MKLRMSDRIGIVLLALVGVAFSAFAGVCAYHVWLNQFASPFCFSGFAPVWNVVIWAAVAVLVLVLSIRVLLVAFRRRERVDKGSVAVQHTEQGNGEVRVSVQALDALVKQAIVGHNEGVADIKTRIVNHEDSVSVKIEMSLNGDVHIPNLTMLLQSSIKNFIEEFSGIAVRDVSIMVTTIIPVNPQLALGATQTSQEPVVIEEAPAAPAIGQPAEAPAPEEPSPAETPAEPEPTPESEPSEPTPEEEPQPVAEESAPEEWPSPEEESEPAPEEEPLFEAEPQPEGEAAEDEDPERM